MILYPITESRHFYLLAVHVENLVKTYDSRRVLDGVNLDAQEGEFYALMGPNGSGKTTPIQSYTQDSLGSSSN
ncbi:MAG: ATP-binding cassette domain-containing protein [Chloroflexota bacterium]|nr:MAG: ATP-binding cassette domain-containing protein [Chloroflexota bacterium]